MTETPIDTCVLLDARTLGRCQKAGIATVEELARRLLEDRAETAALLRLTEEAALDLLEHALPILPERTWKEILGLPAGSGPAPSRDRRKPGSEGAAVEPSSGEDGSGPPRKGDRQRFHVVLPLGLNPDASSWDPPRKVAAKLLGMSNDLVRDSYAVKLGHTCWSHNHWYLHTRSVPSAEIEKLKRNPMILEVGNEHVRYCIEGAGP